MSSVVKLTRNPLGAGYLWTNAANGEQFEIYSVKNMCGLGVKWHAIGDRGSRVQDVELSRVREGLAAHERAARKAA
jgi:hypothetical protein